MRRNIQRQQRDGAAFAAALVGGGGVAAVVVVVVVVGIVIVVDNGVVVVDAVVAAAAVVVGVIVNVDVVGVVVVVVAVVYVVSVAVAAVACNSIGRRPCSFGAFLSHAPQALRVYIPKKVAIIQTGARNAKTDKTILRTIRAGTEYHHSYPTASPPSLRVLPGRRFHLPLHTVVVIPRNIPLVSLPYRAVITSECRFLILTAPEKWGPFSKSLLSHPTAIRTQVNHSYKYSSGPSTNSAGIYMRQATIPALYSVNRHYRGT